MKRKPPTVYLTVGLPGSGKSAWARRKSLSNPSTVIVCRDDLRTMLLGRYALVRRIEGLVSRLSEGMILEALRSGHDVIVDETNLTAGRRREWLRLLRRTDRNIRTVFVHFTETERNLALRMEDPRGLSRRTWSSVITTMRYRLENPCASEGCDRIVTVGPVGRRRKR